MWFHTVAQLRGGYGGLGLVFAKCVNETCLTEYHCKYMGSVLFAINNGH